MPTKPYTIGSYRGARITCSTLQVESCFLPAASRSNCEASSVCGAKGAQVELQIQVHGGVPRTPGITIADIRATLDSADPVDGSVVSDMLWSDPTDSHGTHPSPRNIGGISYLPLTKWTGVLFGPDVAARFLQENNLEVMVRAHELCMEGYSKQQGGKVPCRIPVLR